MALRGAVEAYNDDEVYDFTYRKISGDLDRLETHMGHLLSLSDFSLYEPSVETYCLYERFYEFHGLFNRLIGKNDNGYIHTEMYEDKLEPNDRIRNLFRGENNGMNKIIIKDTFSPGKVDALSKLGKFFLNGNLELLQNEDKFERVTKDSVEELRQELSVLPISLAELVNQERRGSN